MTRFFCILIAACLWALASASLLPWFPRVRTLAPVGFGAVILLAISPKQINAVLVFALAVSIIHSVFLGKPPAILFFIFLSAFILAGPIQRFWGMKRSLPSVLVLSLLFALLEFWVGGLMMTSSLSGDFLKRLTAGWAAAAAWNVFGVLTVFWVSNLIRGHLKIQFLPHSQHSDIPYGHHIMKTHLEAIKIDKMRSFGA